VTGPPTEQSFEKAVQLAEVGRPSRPQSMSVASIMSLRNSLVHRMFVSGFLKRVSDWLAIGLGESHC
jgi:hypothetical protein